MMASISTILWLCFTCHLITAEHYSTVSANKVQSHEYNNFDKCHHYMSKAERTDCLFDQVQNYVNVMNDKINEVVVSVTEYEKHLKDVQLKFNEEIDKVHRVTVRVEGRIAIIGKDFSSEMRGISIDLNNKITKLDDTVAEVRGNIEQLKSESKSNVRSRSTSLNELNSSMLENVSNMNKTVHKMIDEVKNDMNEELDKFDQQLYGFNKSTNSKIQQLDDTFLGTRSSISTVEQRVMRIENTAGTFQSDISGLKESVKEVQLHTQTLIDSRYNELIRQMNEKDLVLKNSIESTDRDKTVKLEAHDTQISDISKKLYSAVSKLESKFDNDLKTLKGDIDRKLSESEAYVKKVEDATEVKVKDLDAAISLSLEKLESDMVTTRSQISEEIHLLAQSLSAETREVNQKVTQQQSILDVVYANAFDKGMLILAILLLFVFIGINYFIVYIIVKRTKPAQVSASNVMSRSMTLREPRSPTEVRNWFGIHEPLQNAICVISFSEQSQKYNKKLMKSLHEELPDAYYDKVTYHVIRRHEDIPETPVVKLCFMFVEFTERHVIIEQPGLGLGDLKRKTFTYVTESGGCLVIIYEKDPESRKLSDEDLYNHKIHCVSSQAELVSLREQDCFISIYDKFNVCQSKCLLKLIRDNVK